MAITAFSQWSATPSSNTDLNSVSLQEGVTRVPQFNNLLREMMAQLAVWRVAPQFDTSNLAIVSTDATAAVGPAFEAYRNSASPAASDLLGVINFYGQDSAGNKQLYARELARIEDATSTSEDGSLFWGVVTAGTFGDEMFLTGAILAPATSDGLALGSTGNMWSDVFLASGGVINWNAGDVAITHSANTLAFGGASGGYTFDSAVKPSADDAGALGASGAGWSDAFFASGAVLNFNAGNVTITHAAGSLSVSATVVGFSGSIKTGDGAVGTPTHTFTSDNDTGFWWGSSGEVGYTSNGVQTAYLTDTSVIVGSAIAAWNMGAGTQDGVYLQKTGAIGASKDGAVVVSLRRRTSDGAIVNFNRDTTTVGSISVTTTATAYNTSSDYRLPWKEGARPLTADESGAFIDALLPLHFPVVGHAGFVAHEFAEVSPTSVQGEKDAVDDDGSPIYQSMQASTADVMANLVAEVKNLRKRVFDLEQAG